MTTKNTKKRKKAGARSKAQSAHGPVWPVQEARSSLRSLIDAARAGEPQIITSNGREQVAVVRIEDMPQRRQKPRPPVSLLEFFEKSPFAEAVAEGLIDPDDFTRSRSPLKAPVEFDEE